MTKYILILMVLLGPLSFSQENSLFTSLTGLDDSLGVTHLYYRSGKSIDIYNPVYHFIPGTLIDSAFIDAYLINYPPPIGEIAKAVLDFNFYKGDPEKYLAAGFSIYPDNHGYIERFDGAAYGGVNNIGHLNFSSQNPDLMYANAGILLKSSNGGITWQDQNRPTFPIISLSPFDDKVMFGIDHDNSLIKSLDSGNTYYSVDTANWDDDSRMYFDPDGVHIYCVSNGYNYNLMKLSTGGGEPFSWMIREQSGQPIYFSNDTEIPGLIFYANGKNIYKSNDFGITFNPYKTLERNIIGIYKKPNEDKIYAATKYKIYEITNDSLIVLKSLAIDPDILDWFPLTIGNKWVYISYLIDQFGETNFEKFSTMQVIGQSEINGINYTTVLNDCLNYYSFVDTLYLRPDLDEGRIYRFDKDSNSEVLFYDLLIELGDTLYVDMDWVKSIVLEEINSVYLFETNTTEWYFRENGPCSCGHTLTKGFGMTNSYFDELGGQRDFLKGCVINGIVYGDTTVTDVKEEQTIPKQFVLYQNYPNPFNPNTNINYDLPVNSRVTLKIFDILGREIKTLVDEFQQAGDHQINFQSTADMPSGVYFYQLSTDGSAQNFISVKKMLLLK